MQTFLLSSYIYICVKNIVIFNAEFTNRLRRRGTWKTNKDEQMGKEVQILATSSKYIF